MIIEIKEAREIARKFLAEYNKEWRRRNPDKVERYKERLREKRRAAKEAKQKEA